MATNLLPMILIGATVFVHGCNGNVATVVDAVAVTPGKPYILVMFDFHRKLGDDGKCMEINPRAVELMWSLRWIDEVLQSNPINKIGLLLHDTCGSERRAIQIVSRYLNPEVCMNDTSLAGIMSYTTKEIRKNITNLVRPFGILHTEISNDQFLTLGSGTVLDLSTISIWKIQAVFTLLNKANWSYVSTVTADSDDARAEQKLFSRMADDQNICVADSIFLQNISTMPSTKSKVVVIFITGVNDTHELISSITNMNDSVFIVVSDSYLDNLSVQNTSNVIFLREEFPSKYYITTYVKNMLQKFQESETLTAEYLSHLTFCQKNSTSGYINCSEDFVNFISKRMRGRDLTAILTAFFNLERLLIVADRSNCTNYNFLTCPEERAYVSLSIYQPSTGFPFNMFELTEGWVVDEVANISVMTFTDSLVQVGTIFKWTLMPRNDSLIHNFLDVLNGTESCGERCLKCGECKYQPFVDETMAFNEGDLYIGGLFPIHKLSLNGDTCGGWSWEAVQLAEAFLYALKTVKDRYTEMDLLPGIRLGGIVIDTCKKSGYVRNLLMSMKGCPSSFGNVSVVNRDILSFIQFGNSSEMKPFAVNVDKDDIMLKLTPSSVSLNGFSYTNYMDETTEVLLALNWTYISIVFSQDVHDDTGVQKSIANLKKKGICLSSVIVLNSDGSDQWNDVEKLFATGHKTDVVLLLTNSEDTLIVLERAKIASSMNIVLMPWNVPRNDQELIEGTVLIQTRQNSHSDFNNYLHSIDSKTYKLNPWLAKFHESYHRCHFNVDSDLLYPEECSRNATAVGLHNSTLSSNIIDTMDLLIMSIDKLYKDLCPEKNGLCKAFKDNDELAKQIKTELFKARLIKDNKDIVKFNGEGNMETHLDVINYQFKSGSTHTVPVIVGQFTNGSLTMKRNSVMTYDVNKIPFVTPHQCNGWCPECVSCSSAQRAADIEYSYNHGDIVLSAILPIHTKSRVPFTCGTINTGEDINNIISAFQFAVNTAKSRYRYLLPNVSVGSIVLDSCADVDAVQKTISNFETCSTSFTESNGDVFLYPDQVLGYVLYGDTVVTSQSSQLLQRLNKPSLLLGDTQSIRQDSLSSYLFESKQQDTVYALMEFLIAMDWTNVVLVHSDHSDYNKTMKMLMTYANSYNVCVSDVLSIENTNPTTSVEIAVKSISQSSANTVVVLALYEDVKHLLSALVARFVYKNLIFGEIDRNWEDMKGLGLPLGSIVVNKAGKVNSQYNKTYDTNPWSDRFKAARVSCQKDNFGNCAISTSTERTMSNVILSVDVMLHALDKKYRKRCPVQNGLCREMTDIKTASLDVEADLFANVSFIYDNASTIKIPADEAVHWTYIFKNFQKTGFEEVGRWKDGIASIHTEKVKFYDSNGNLESKPRETECFPQCFCLNYDQYNQSDKEPETTDPYKDFLFYETSGEFDSSIWCVAILTLCASGALCALIFVIYALVKVCSGLLERRYIGLGVTMLSSIILLYMSVLPFLFTPSDTVCASRRFIPGLAFAFVFATVLAKLMALRAYKLIGLGGEISNLNQFLAILFITGVQIAIGVQWLVYRDTFLIIQPDSALKYACDFNTMEYLKYQVYIMFIIVLTSVYSVTVRNEKKNLGEARLILVASWLITAVWIAWVVMVTIQSREYLEPSICIVVFVCSTFILVIVFAPRVHRIANLHYSVKKDGMENGGLGKIDYEFIFERPYTLPASDVSSFRYAEKTNPKSISTFDTHLSY